jgi:hypothetical protein
LLAGFHIFNNFLQKNIGHLQDECTYIKVTYWEVAVAVRVGDQLVWVTLEGSVPLPTNYAPSSEDILGMKG